MVVFDGMNGTFKVQADFPSSEFASNERRKVNRPMPPCKESQFCINIYENDDPKIINVKRCVCFSNPGNCPYHPNSENEEESVDSKRTPRINSCKSMKSNTTSNITEMNLKLNEKNYESDGGIGVKTSYSSTDDLSLSISSSSDLTTVRYVGEPLIKDAYFREWCAKKDFEKKLLERKRRLIEELEKKKREQRLEEERENFRRWLAQKKIEEEEKRKELEDKAKAERMSQEMKEKRLQDNKMKYDSWLKKKQEQLLERKIKEQMKESQKEQERQKRLDYSAKAYEIWLQQARSKNKFQSSYNLDTKRSSSSLSSTSSFINPEPWIPNIDLTNDLT